VVAPAPEPSTQSDAELALQLRQGDEAAFGALYERYARPVHDFVARIVREPATAEDVTQATFAQVWERRESLRSPEAVKRWIYQIAHNFALSQVTRGQTTVPMEEELQLAAMEPGPEASAESADAARLVWDAAASLEPHQLAILDLSVRCGLASSEIAEILEMDTARASLQVNRAREALGNAVRYLLVARRRSHCERLRELVPAGVAQLSPEQRATVDHHMRRCPGCQGMALRLTAPEELFGSLLLLPLPRRILAPPHVALAAHMAAMSTAGRLAGEPPRPMVGHPVVKLLHPASRLQTAVAAAVALVLVGGAIFGVTRIATGGGSRAASGQSQPGPIVGASPTSSVSSWSVLPAEGGSASVLGMLFGVACDRPGDCWAVGLSQGNNPASAQLIVHLTENDSWAVVAGPATVNGRLQGVTCPTPVDCWAVGYVGNGLPGEPLIEHYDGERWDIVTPPSVPSTGDLLSVACPSATTCWAVGSETDESGTPVPAIAELQDGSWTMRPAPQGSNENDTLNAVSCVGGDDCWAVGDADQERVPIIDHFDGSVWSTVAGPSQPADATTWPNDLEGVACSSAAACWSVGEGPALGQIAGYTKAAGWGSSVELPASGPYGGDLWGVACAAQGDCWAVGTNGDTQQTVLEHERNGTWAAASSPAIPGGPYAVLRSITCPAPNQCWAVGFTGTGSSDISPLVEVGR
jgi:RNA polymerase sigma factor (sigma-70 family)